MRLGIVGSREFLDYSLLAETVDSFVEKTKIKVEKIVSGGAKGADSLRNTATRSKNSNQIMAAMAVAPLCNETQPLLKTLTSFSPL